MGTHINSWQTIYKPQRLDQNSKSVPSPSLPTSFLKRSWIQLLSLSLNRTSLSLGFSQGFKILVCTFWSSYACGRIRCLAELICRNSLLWLHLLLPSFSPSSFRYSQLCKFSCNCVLYILDIFHSCFPSFFSFADVYWAICESPVTPCPSKAFFISVNIFYF